MVETMRGEPGSARLDRPRMMSIATTIGDAAITHARRVPPDERRFLPTSGAFLPSAQQRLLALANRQVSSSGVLQ
jgi:hypothetical protein